VIGELYKRLVLLDYPEELPEDAKKLPKMSYAQYYEMVKASLVEAANEFPKRWVSTDEHWNATGEVPAQLYHFEAWYNKYLAGLCTSIETYWVMLPSLRMRSSGILNIEDVRDCVWYVRQEIGVHSPLLTKNHSPDGRMKDD